MSTDRTGGSVAPVPDLVHVGPDETGLGAVAAQRYLDQVLGSHLLREAEPEGELLKLDRARGGDKCGEVRANFVQFAARHPHAARHATHVSHGLAVYQVRMLGTEARAA